VARLSTRDEARAGDVIALIRETQEFGPAAIDHALPLLRDLLDTEITAGYRLKRSKSGQAESDYFKFHGSPELERETAGLFSEFVRGMAARRGLHDPLHPEKVQRNRVLILPWRQWCGGDGADDVETRLWPSARRFGLSTARVPDAAKTMWELESSLRRIGLRAYNQLRVLLCEDATLLSWVGALQAEPFSERQRLLLRRVAGPLSERLIVERRTGEGGLGHAAMVAALEHVPAAAFVLDAKARVVHANAVGRFRLEQSEGDALRQALGQAIQREAGARSGVVMTKLTGEGLPPLHLAFCSSQGDRVRFAIERARQRWKLTAREVEILAEVAAGRANRDISERLGVAPRTVELHVSSLLRKAHADSRSQLIVDLWHLADAW
jgi:DNA-binding CsgD family transcriptional regulator